MFVIVSYLNFVVIMLDVQTQAMYQMLDECFVGIIFSVFNQDKTSKVFCYTIIWGIKQLSTTRFDFVYQIKLMTSVIGGTAKCVFFHLPLTLEIKYICARFEFVYNSLFCL